MESSDQTEFKIILQCLTIEEIAQIPNDICKKLNNFIGDKFEEFITAKAIFESNRKNLDDKLKQLKQEIQIKRDELRNCQDKLVLTESYTSELQSQLGESRSELFKLQDLIKRLEHENSVCRKNKDEFEEENNTLHSQIERKNAELERLRAELNLLGSQLQTAVAAKCQSFSEVEEIRSREMSLDFRERRLDQERSLLSQQMVGLEEELLRRTAELQNVRSEAASSALLTQTRLNQCEEELKITNNATVHIREVNATLQRRCEELTQKLDDQRNQELALHASYQEEIAAQTRLAEIYKKMSEEANAKAIEYTNAVKELQELLEQATEQYGTMESKYNQCTANYDKQIVDKENQIQKLSKELDSANQLLLSLKQERLDQAVEQLAPTAAVASKILKKGLSLTQIYTQLVDATNEISLVREEKEKLKFQMEIILRELEEKAPILQQQREEYQTAVNNSTTLSIRVDELLNENCRLQENVNETERLINHHTRENQRLKNEISDLARQVCYLLKEIQESRNGNDVPNDEFEIIKIDNLASSHIISKTLVTFKDIETLQENNQKLLSIVRTLSLRQEEIEKATDEIYSGEMKKKLDRYIDQLSEMQAAQDRQSKMLEGLLKQRDMYKNMYQQCINENALDSQKKILTDLGEESTRNSALYNFNEKNISENEQSYQRKLEEYETKISHLSNEFELYKKEKTAHENLLNNEIERLRRESEKNSTNCCKLKAQLDSANDRFNLLQGNVSTYKSQIKILEDKCSNYSTTIGKHEHTLMVLKNETLTAQSCLSKSEVQLENVRQENRLLRDSEGRLLKEREVLQRERHTHALLKADVESIKASLERSQAEGLLRTEQRLDDSIRECAALRRRLQEEQDHFRELSFTLERQIIKSEEKLKEERSLSCRIKDELEAVRLSEQDCLKRIENLNCKLKDVSAYNISQTLTGDESSSRKLKDLEFQLSNHQAEIKSLTDQLKASRYQSQQYCDIAESAETQLRQTTEMYNTAKQHLENTIKLTQDESASLKKKIKELEDELKNVSTGQQLNDLDLKKKILETEEKLKEFDLLKSELDVTRGDLKTATMAAALAEDKYGREMVLHSTDLQILAKLKEENYLTSQKLLELTQLNDLAQENLITEKSMWQEREKRLQNEIKELQKRVENLDAQNNILHNEIQEISERTAIIQSQQPATINYQISPNTSIESVNKSFAEENSKSAEQLLQVMKYLRREKDLSIAKCDVLKSENMRLKSQIENAEKRIQELKETLERERENNDISVVTVSKHSELLRKVETLNAITDSNRILREERDALNKRIQDLADNLNLLSNEVTPLREKLRDSEAKNDAILQENVSLKAEAMRWRQRANTLVERANKASPEDWRRLQTERENLSKLLTSERETYAKRAEEFNNLKSDKIRLEEQINQLQRQLQSQEEKIEKVIEDERKVRQDLNDSIAESNVKAKDLIDLKKELANKDAMISDVKNKEIQIRKIAKKYKTQYEELARNVEEEKSRTDNRQIDNSRLIAEDTPQISQEKENQLKEEGRLELRQINSELSLKADDLSQQILIMQSESQNLRKEIETINKTSLEKEERAKQVLKSARAKIMQLTEHKKQSEKEINDLKERLDTNTGEYESNISEYEARLTALKSQMEGRISRLEHERSDLHAEKEALAQRISQLQRQLAGQNNISAGVTEPPTANIKPMSARTETPLASIRPMSVVVQSRTAAVLPTTAGTPLLVVPQQSQQQLVHTTETSSPTSSHVDYQPASTSRHLIVQPQLNESAESTQREDIEAIESQTVQQQQIQQQQQQTVALVIPRVEQHQHQQQQNISTDQQQTVPSSSTQSVTTSHTSTSQKRPRTLDSPASGSSCENSDHTRQEQITSPNNKRSRQQDVTLSTAASASDIEYQVPTSSQRDQDEEGEDGCVVIDCDESGNHQAQEEEEFDNDPYEEIEEEELAYGVEVDNNEVEIIMEEDSTEVEIPRDTQSELQTNQQQSETISSAGTTAEPSTFICRSRGIAPMPRQQPQQHLILPQQGYEDAGDDCIVPSTPTLFVPRRNDGFGEAVSSPQVPQARFTFGDPSTSTSVSSVQSLSTPSITGSRSIYNATASGLVQVMQEGMDDTRIDLTQLEDNSTGRSVPTTPQQVSPCTEPPGSIISGPLDEQRISTPCLSDSQINAVECVGETTASGVGMIQIIDRERNVVDIIPDSETAIIADVNQLDNDQRAGTVDVPGSATEGDMIEVELEAPEDTSGEIIDQSTHQENREAEASPSCNTRQKSMAVSVAGSSISAPSIRGATARRSSRTSFRTTRGSRPTPIVWDNQSSPRGQNVVRGHGARSGSNENIRVRGGRGRRSRAKYPYTY